MTTRGQPTPELLVRAERSLDEALTLLSVVYGRLENGEEADEGNGLNLAEAIQATANAQAALGDVVP